MEIRDREIRDREIRDREIISGLQDCTLPKASAFKKEQSEDCIHVGTSQ